MSIQLDPVTKLPIWPGGVVPEHPRNRDGDLIMAPPTWVPPPSDFMPPTPPDVINPQGRDLVDEFDHLKADVSVLRLRIEALEMALSVLEPKADAQEVRNVDAQFLVTQKLANYDFRVAEMERKLDVDSLQAP